MKLAEEGWGPSTPPSQRVRRGRREAHRRGSPPLHDGDEGGLAAQPHKGRGLEAQRRRLRRRRALQPGDPPDRSGDPGLQGGLRTPPPSSPTLGRFISAKLKGESAGDLSETIAYLKRAERAFELAAPDLGMISAFQIREARLKTRGSRRSREEVGGEGRPLKAGQSALLLMGRVLTRTALAEAAEP